MKKLFILITILVSSNYLINSQDLEKLAPQGFDIPRANIEHGKIDTIHYPSKTVGTIRRALIYTPPGYS